MSKPTVELTEAEWPVIKAVWENESCTAPTIQEKLLKPTGWTYSTVRTLMDRMVVCRFAQGQKRREADDLSCGGHGRFRRSAVNSVTR